MRLFLPELTGGGPRFWPRARPRVLMRGIPLRLSLSQRCGSTSELRCPNCHAGPWRFEMGERSSLAGIVESRAASQAGGRLPHDVCFPPGLFNPWHRRSVLATAAEFACPVTPIRSRFMQTRPPSANQQGLDLCRHYTNCPRRRQGNCAAEATGQRLAVGHSRRCSVRAARHAKGQKHIDFFSG
jgi:hypothetical protein